MVSKGKGGQSKPGKPTPSLSEAAHKQIIDYLRLAGKSPYPDIRAAALDIAKKTSKHHRQQGAKVSPALILVLNIVLVVVVGLASWYAFLNYPVRLAYELVGISVLLWLAFVAISLFLPGYLSQANFMKILGWLASHVKGSRKSDADEATPSESENGNAS